jgi:molecular chaperone GrpE
MPQNPEQQPATDPAAPGREAEDDAGLDQVEKDLDELLDETKRERDEYLDLAKRTRADFENYRKRAAEQARDAEARGKGSLARELVPVLDNLRRALDAPAGESLTEGVQMVHKDLGETLQRAGVEEYDPAGERFDPSWHEALATRPEEGTDAGVVVETVEKGYRLDGQVLRPAKVIVSE